jgi:hypothetical protein
MSAVKAEAGGREGMIRLAIRGYAAGQVQFEDLVTLPDEEAIEHLVPGLAEKHAAALANHKLHLIEIEFLDEPDPMQRFFRFGTDPSGMVMPIGTKL